MQGKKRYLALVLFLLLGLITFSFANPDDQLEPVEGNVKKVSDQKDEKRVQTKFDKAKDLVEQAEQNPTVEIIAEAEEAIEEAEEDYLEQIQEEDLVNRLNNTEPAIDAAALINAVEKMIDEATKKDDVSAAKTYFDNNNVATVTNNLEDGTVKENLNIRVAYLVKVFADETAPVITGIENNQTTNIDVALTISDDLDVNKKITLDGEEIEFKDTFNKDGVYVVVVTDDAQNTTSVTFTIDKVKPKFEGLPSREAHIESYKVDVTDATDVAITLQKDHGTFVDIEEGYEIIEEGTYQLVGVDKAGNKYTTWIIIDKTAPTITNSIEGEYINQCTTVTVFDRYMDKVTINDDVYKRADFTKNTRNENFKLEKEICEAGTYTITATDKIGKKTTKTFTIDKTKIGVASANMYTNGKKYTVDKDTYYYATNGQKITAYVRVKEQSVTLPVITLTINGKDYVLDNVKESFHKKEDEEAGIYKYQGTFIIPEDMNVSNATISYTVTNITDKAGNETTVSKVTNKNINVVDTVKPKYDKIALVGGKGYWFGKEYKQLATNNTIVYVNVRMYEKLATTPIVTLNDTITLTKPGSVKEADGIWIYSYSYKLTEGDGIADGVLQVKVTNIEDKAGNSIELTNEHATMESQSEITIDRKAITIEGIDASEYTYNGVGVTPSTNDTDIKSVKLEKDGEAVKGYELGTAIINAGSYKLTVTDLAGNKTVVEFVINKKQLEFELSVDEAYEYSGNEIKATINVTNAESTDLYEIDDRYYIKDEKGSFKGPLKVDYAKDLGEYKVKVVVKSKNENYSDSETKSLTFKVVDTTSPTISLPFPIGKETYEYRVEAGTKVTIEDIIATVTDNHDETTTIKPYKADLLIGKKEDNTYNYDLSKGIDTNYSGRYNIYYKHTDESGNESKLTLLLIMKDTKVPTTKITEKGNTVYVKGEDVTRLKYSIIKDNKEVHTVDSETCNCGNYFSITWLAKTYGDGEYAIKVTDAGGNTTSTSAIVDTTAPEVTPSYTEKDVEINSTEEFNQYPTFETKDTYSEPITETFISGKVDMSKLGKYELVYRFTDDRENFIDKTIVVNVVDTTAPEVVASYTEKNISEVSKGEFDEFPTFETTDNSKGKVTQKLHSGKVDPTNAGTYELVYRFTDESGNYKDVTITINVVDTTPPKIAGVEEGLFYNTKDTHAVPMVTDKHLKSITIISNFGELGELSSPWKNNEEIVQPGNYKLVAEDEAGNKTEVNFVVDNIAPIILLLDKLQFIQGDLIPIKPVVVEQYIDTVTLVKDGEAVEGYTLDQAITGDANYELTVTDKAGNSATATFTMDDESPRIKQPNPLTNAYNEFTIEVEDNNYDPEDLFVFKKNRDVQLGDYSIPYYEPYKLEEGNYTLTEEGSYYILVYDKAYNVDVAKVIIDRTKPTTNLVDGGFYKEVTPKAEDANLLTVLLFKNSVIPVISYSHGDTITEEGEYTIAAADSAGNYTYVSFTVDSTAPEYTIPVGKEILAGKDGTVSTTATDKVDGDIEVIPNVTKIENGVETDLGKQKNIDTSVAGVSYRLDYSVVDRAGNDNNQTTTVSIVEITYEIRLDQTEFSGVYNGKAHSLPTDITGEVVKIKNGVIDDTFEGAEITYALAKGVELKDAKKYEKAIVATAVVNGNEYNAYANYTVEQAILTVVSMPTTLAKGDTVSTINSKMVFENQNGEEIKNVESTTILYHDEEACIDLGFYKKCLGNYYLPKGDDYVVDTGSYYYTVTIYNDNYKLDNTITVKSYEIKLQKPYIFETTADIPYSVKSNTIEVN